MLFDPESGNSRRRVIGAHSESFISLILDDTFVCVSHVMVYNRFRCYRVNLKSPPA